MKEGFLDEVFERKSKTADRIGPALIKTGFAASGGLIAGRVDAIASEQWPKSAVAGPFLVALISIGLRIFADGASAMEKVAQELAAGMAGWIGDDLWYLMRNFLGLGFKKWEPGKGYDKGAQVSTDYDSFAEYVGLRFGDILMPYIKVGEPLRIECNHFLDCVRTRRRPVSDGHDGLRVVKVLDAAQRSLKANGQPVRIAPL